MPTREELVSLVLRSVVVPESALFEDVFPIQNGDVALPC